MSSNELVVTKKRYPAGWTIVDHIPPKAEYQSRWFVHDHEVRQKFAAQSNDTLERKAVRVIEAIDWESLEEVVCEPGWLDRLSLERYIFFLVYPSHPSIRYQGQVVSFCQLPLSKMGGAGLKSAFFQLLTITRAMSFHPMIVEEDLSRTYYVIVNPGATFTFFEGTGKHLVTIKATHTYVVSEGICAGQEITVPAQVHEQTRAALLSTTLVVRFTEAESYQSSMAAYYAQTNRRHAQLLSSVLKSIPESVRCVFPMDGTGIGARLRPGSVSGDRASHWLTAPDTLQEEAKDTVLRAQPGDAIIVMYGATFLDQETVSILKERQHTVILVDAHLYPLPLDNLTVWGSTIWGYNVPWEMPALPSDTIEISETPLYSDNLLYLNEVIDVQEWVKTVAWYVDQKGKVTSSLPWMKQFLLAIKANVVEGQGVPVFMSYDKAVETGKPFFFIPTGTMSHEPQEVKDDVEIQLDVGKLYQVSARMRPAFKYGCGDIVWSSHAVDYEHFSQSDSYKAKYHIVFSPPSMGVVQVKMMDTLMIRNNGVSATFNRHRPEDFPKSASKLYGNSVPTTFITVMQSWYGGVPPQLHKVKGKVYTRGRGRKKR